MNKPHKHAEIIKQWADGAEIECHYKSLNKWYVVNDPAWSGDFEFRVKPIWTPRYIIKTALGAGLRKDVAVPKAVCNYYIIQQFVEEFENDWGNQGYQVYKLADGKYSAMWDGTNNFSLGTLSMSKECAEKLRDMLNNGEIEL